MSQQQQCEQRQGKALPLLPGDGSHTLEPALPLSSPREKKKKKKKPRPDLISTGPESSEAHQRLRRDSHHQPDTLVSTGVKSTLNLLFAIVAFCICDLVY